MVRASGAQAHTRDRLGDRHGENILFDSSSGDTVHVDLNCLFEKVRDPAFSLFAAC